MAGRSSDGVQTATPSDESSISSFEISDLLPLELIKSETIPPSPNRSESTIDWLPDFASFSWIAYGASSLLVISHFPSPLSQEETLIGPIFRQSIQLSVADDESSAVKAVAWSPSIPSEGEIAVAIENCICLCSESSRSTHGSFCWTQIAVLVQSYNVEAIKWTGSGDGIITAGIEVVLWKRKSKTWEIAWKFTAEQPQTLVSATWSTEGPVATVAYSNGSSSLCRESSTCVLVSQSDGKSGLVKSELLHPQPASMIQWRPSTRSRWQRDVLLSCCLDGTVRLWSEIDSGRIKKFDQKTMKRSFHVTAVIEINQSLNGSLGIDIFVAWAVEIKGVVNTGEGVHQCLSNEGSEYDKPGRCEWLVEFGPKASLSFWAVHCLDDISPLRFPRVTLWKRQDLIGPEGHCIQNTGNSKGQSFFIKDVIFRSHLSGPPTICSLLQLLPDNIMSWSLLYTLASSNTKEGSLNLDGHSGKILRVAVHPHSCEVELAVSLDSNGFLLFWSLSTISNCILGMPTLVLPTWKLLGSIATQNLSCFEYSSLTWAPLVLNENRVLLMGHAGGIDCFLIRISEIEEEKIVCHKLCTMPFTGHSHGDGPANIFAIPLASTCGQTFTFSNFLLLGVWMPEFQALSWNFSLHSDELSANCGAWRYESTFLGERYCVVADPCSSKLPDLHNHDQVTSVAVICPGNWFPSVQQKWVSSNGMCSSSASYHMATGCSDGSVKLWRSTPSKPWELVGMFTAHQGPINAISLSGCGRKLATISMEDHLNKSSNLRIWETVRVIGAGNFLLEDNISLDGVVIALNWLAIGNGRLLLGVCMQNELRIYAQRRFDSQTSVKSSLAFETHIWICIAFGRTSPAAQDFLWGPGATPVIVHERFFCLFNKWSFCMDKKLCYPNCTNGNPLHCLDGTDKDMFCSIFMDSKELSMDEKSEECKHMLPTRINLKNDYRNYNIFSAMSQQLYDSGTKMGCWSMLEVAEKLCGSLPIYHPEALLMNLYSGNWKRACVAVRHLVGYLTSDNTSVTCEKVYNSARPNHAIPQIDLSTYFEEPSSTSLGDKGLQWGRDSALFTSATQYQRSSIQFIGNNSNINNSSSVFTSTSGKSEISGFVETLEKSHDIAALTSLERIQMLAVIDLLIEISDSCCASVYESLDGPGRRFWVAVRFKQLYFLRRFGRLALVEELVVDSGLIGWAFHSDCQENLFSSLLSTEPSWQEMRTLGVGFWFTNATQLRTRMEKLARLQYLKNKNPKDCALLYVALNRLQVLAGLFKISKDEKDKPLVGFLSRNFQEEKNKAAALKNAYVLMGRHQLELAVAFFLLGGDPSSAINVCAKNLGDEQLALVICRLVEGYGGPLERHLISNFLLPAATEKGDYWLASLLECTLGNYSQSFLELFGFKMDSLIKKSVLPSNQSAFSDPKVGQYCLILATKSTMKNSVGESAAAMLARWATLMTSTALDRCGLPLEALDCLSSSLSSLEGKDEGSISDKGNHGILHGILKASPSDTSNWLSGDVAMHLESNVKFDLALQYISKLILEHPSWPDTILTSCGPLVCYKEHENDQYELSLEKFHHKLYRGLTTFEQKYYLNSVDLINMILVSSCNNGLLFLGYHILHCYTSQEHPNNKNHTVDSLIAYPTILGLFLKATEEVSYLFARYIVVCGITCCPPDPSSSELNMFGTRKSSELHAWDVYMQGLMHSLKSLRTMLKIYLSGFITDDLTMTSFISLDLFEYYLLLASAWIQRNLKGLILMIHPILIPYTNGHNPEIDVSDLKKLIFLSAELKTCNLSSDGVGSPPVATCQQWKQGQNRDTMLSVPEDERWQLIGVCLWRHLSNFTKDQLKAVSVSLEDGYSTRSSLGIPSSSTFYYESFESDENRTQIPFKQVPLFLAKLLKSTLACICSSHAKQLVSFLGQKVEKGLVVPTIAWLEESKQSQPRVQYNCLNQGISSLQLINNENWTSLFEILWEISADPKEIREGFSQEKISLLKSIDQKPSTGWSNMHKDIRSGSENVDIPNGDQEGRISSSANGGTGSPGWRRSQGNHIFSGSRRKELTLIKELTCFQNPEERFKRNGELLESICINSIDQQEVAVASNRKGIMFFKCKDEEPSEHQSDYIWSVADWPQDGWAKSESTPIPTFVSPGIGLGSKKGTHLGLGGATIGLGSLARPGRDLTGGGAFGIPGYAGIGASGLGWGTQEDFEEFVDPPATIANISTRALSSHPSRPFFLAGSSNTHIYLWEFGKERATATYGVLPAANVPPPYALASISALQFDHCGHRFATAALDGTVCTWQLEVGGRSNVRPTESSLCFNSHASDVTYMAASGSVIAAAGYSSNDVNVVIWDTLAPPTTSQASLICHEGGARSVSVFDNDIGSGSISPLIVTGGKGGDVGLHDFRFIATGKTKRHRHSNSTHDTLPGISNKSGEQNRMGMLWYIPKAHLGSVTKIATIPDTSLFLTGSKDGDVKLWDAKRSELVFHWPKLHERHTFLQPSSRGFGGMVQAAVTDIQVLSRGFLTCGGDGTVKQIQFKDLV